VVVNFTIDFCVRFLQFALDLQGRRLRLDGYHGGEIDWLTPYTLNFALHLHLDHQIRFSKSDDVQRNMFSEMWAKLVRANWASQPQIDDGQYLFVPQDILSKCVGGWGKLFKRNILRVTKIIYQINLNLAHLELNP
jgi:hypothetical protein